MLLKMEKYVNASLRIFQASLEMSLFLICCCPWGVRRSEALRRGLCGAFRAKRRRTPQRVMTLAIDSVAAASFSARSLAARDDPAQTYSLPCTHRTHRRPLQPDLLRGRCVGDISNGR